MLHFLRSDAAIADFSTVTPDTKRSAADLAAGHGIRYVDPAILGAPPPLGCRHMAAAGAGTEALQCVPGRFGGLIRIFLNGALGDTMSLKLLRSVLTKGETG